MNIGENIRKIRDLKGFSQEYMAAKLKMSQRQYSRIEKEETKLDLQKLEEIGKVLEVTPIQLLGFDEKQIFNQYNNETANGVYHNHFPEELKAQYEKQIASLESEIAFLKKVIEEKL